ncbi:VOC family protein [Glutamicibacter protophormiae]|uniref:VOC family protein n=1 Tax=Glutamicibacter protophormiae TaxID=37930 RepID=UPI003326E801
MEATPEMTMQLTIDCAHPQLMVEFWAEALGYVQEPPPAGHASWRTYWQDLGVPDEELPPGSGDLPESIIDPTGRGPRIWFQQVPESKTLKNRWHFDLKVGGGRSVPLETRVERVRATAGRLTSPERPSSASTTSRPWASTRSPCRIRRATNSTWFNLRQYSSIL